MFPRGLLLLASVLVRIQRERAGDHGESIGKGETLRWMLKLVWWIQRGERKGGSWEGRGRGVLDWRIAATAACQRQNKVCPSYPSFHVHVSRSLSVYLPVASSVSLGLSFP